MHIYRFFTIFFALSDITSKGRKIGEQTPENKKKYGRYLKEKLEGLGPTFVKFGQMLSVRFDLLPTEVCLELQGLLNKEAPFPTEIAKEIIEREVGIPIDRLFQYFPEEPMATASIGQVYKAVLHNGQPVAVKVQRPEAEHSITRDLKIFERIVRNSKVLKFSRMLRLEQMFNEFKGWTVKELDYLKEVSNLETFAYKFKDTRDLIIPKVYRDYSTRRILITEFIEGVTVEEMMQQSADPTNDYIEIGEGYLKKSEIVGTVADVLAEQSIEKGIFHADPHPANILITNDGKVCLIDFGIIGEMDAHAMKKVREVLIALSEGDAQKITDVALEIDEKKGDEQPEKLKAELAQYITQYVGVKIEEKSFTSFITDLLYMGSKYGIQWPIGFVLFGKQFITLDGIALKLAPQMDVIGRFTPYARRLALTETFEKFNPQNISQQAYKVLNKVTAFPETAVKLMDSAQKYLDKLSEVEVEPQQIANAVSSMEPRSNNYLPIIGVIFISTIFLTLLLSTNNLLTGPSLIFMWCLGIIEALTAAILLVKHS